ncbi:unnamed protein product [Victoria cruziana]
MVPTIHRWIILDFSRGM